MRTFVWAMMMAAAVAVHGAPVCVDGVCYPSEEAARADGVTDARLAAALNDHVDAPGPETERPAARVAFGYRKPAEMVAFLRGEESGRGLADHALWVILLLVLAGGLTANLTPCVLPLVPVNLILVGRGAARGAAYGLGITAAYGGLGLAAAFGGMMFGALQSSPWFALAAAGVFTALGLAMLEVFFLDFSRFRPKTGGRAAGRGAARGGLWRPFLLGAGAAVLAGACVEPILIATLALTADWFAAGRTWAVVLPFVLGAGMGLPWPFAAAGFAVLPKPGAWMRWVNRAFAVLMFAMAAWYGLSAVRGFRARGAVADGGGTAGAAFAAVPATWEATLAAARATGKPVFVDVWATWCKNCRAMERTTFRDAAVARALARFAVVRLQAEDLSALADLTELNGLGIKGIPAFVILDETK